MNENNEKLILTKKEKFKRVLFVIGRIFMFLFLGLWVCLLCLRCSNIINSSVHEKDNVISQQLRNVRAVTESGQRYYIFDEDDSSLSGQVVVQFFDATSEIGIINYYISNLYINYDFESDSIIGLGFSCYTSLNGVDDSDYYEATSNFVNYFNSYSPNVYKLSDITSNSITLSFELHAESDDVYYLIYYVTFDGMPTISNSLNYLNYQSVLENEYLGNLYNQIEARIVLELSLKNTINVYYSSYDEGFEEGKATVLNNPNNYDLYTEQQYINYGQTQYNAGYNENATYDLETKGFLVAFNTIMNAPFNIFNGLLEWELFGVNLFDMFSFIITAVLLGWVIKLFI